MSKTILANVDGWTPLMDEISTAHGIVTSAVFGRIWRFCQMEDGVCKASLETIATDLGIDRATVQRHADKLCELEYLKDLTPDLRNRPHIYVDTGKLQIKVSVTVAHGNTTVAQSNVTVAESQLNKDLKKDSNTVKQPKPKTPQQLMIDTLCSVMGLEVNLNAARVARLASELVGMTVTPAQIESVYGEKDTAWWYQQDWRGKKGQKPTETAIRETLAQAANSNSEIESDPYHGKQVFT